LTRVDGRILLGSILLLLLALMAFVGPYFVGDPFKIDTIHRLRPPSADAWFGTDNFGRSVFSRTIWGGQVSLIVGLSVAVIGTALGLVIGLVAGYVRRADNSIMRVMDGIMSIPSVLLALSLVAVTGASVVTVVMAIAIPEIPRVVRLVRSVVLTIREFAYVEAASGSGSKTITILTRHILPGTLAPLIVQGTYVAASAILTESTLSFLGIGTPATIPTWGNMIATGRTFFEIAPWIILFPGVSIACAIFAINLLGDGLRDSLDPRLSRQALLKRLGKALPNTPNPVAVDSRE